ncbi:MAG: hypothetical protein JXB46_06190, partial [Candidatus Eisenbacteria bacterium]|nr:hypothetical protein [Candidatus Eisenbacteria bacterium]
METRHGSGGCPMAMSPCNEVCGRGPAVHVQDLRLDGMNITFQGQALKIAPLEIVAQRTKAVLKVGEPGWRGPVYTPGTAWLYRAMTRGSLRVTLGGTGLREGTDYGVDYDWGTLGAVAG